MSIGCIIVVGGCVAGGVVVGGCVAGGVVVAGGVIVCAGCVVVGVIVLGAAAPAVPTGVVVGGRTVGPLPGVPVIAGPGSLPQADHTSAMPNHAFAALRMMKTLPSNHPLASLRSASEGVKHAV
jgi:hypothetical protein